MELNISIMQLHKSTARCHKTVMELQDDCRIMKFPKWLMEFYNCFIYPHISIMELYNPIYGDLFEFSISIISFINVINSILNLQHSIYGDQYQ